MCDGKARESPRGSCGQNMFICACCLKIKIANRGPEFVPAGDQPLVLFDG